MAVFTMCHHMTSENDMKIEPHKNQKKRLKTPVVQVSKEQYVDANKLIKCCEMAGHLSHGCFDLKTLAFFFVPCHLNGALNISPDF